MHTYEKLNYIGSNVNWLSYLFFLSILQWLIILVLVYKNREKLYTEIKGFNDRKLRVSFTKDYFFWFWNIYPIIFYLFFYYIEIMWPVWINNLLMIDTTNQEIKNLYLQMFLYLNENKATSIWYYIEIMILFVFFIPTSLWAAFIKQKEKIKNFKSNKSRIYWWDKNICRKIYYIRNIFLFFNLVLISYITLIITKIVIFSILALSIKTLNIFPFHPDKYGGLKTFMEISSIIISIYLLRSAIGIVGFLDHKTEQGESHIIVDLWNFSFLFFGIFYLSILFSKIKYLLNKSYKQYKIDEILSANNYTEWINKYIAEINTSIEIKYKILSEYIDNIQNFYLLYDFNNFPIDLYLYINPVFSFVLPLSLWFLFNSHNYYNKDIIKKKE